MEVEKMKVKIKNNLSVFPNPKQSDVERAPLYWYYERTEFIKCLVAELRDLYKYLDSRGYDGIDLVIIEKVLGKTRKEILGVVPDRIKVVKKFKKNPISFDESKW